MTAWRRLRQDRVALVALGFIAVVAVLAVLAPVIAPYGISDRVHQFRQGPSRHHLFGTDAIGRDVFSRVLFGARVSLTVGFLAAALSSVVGVALGALAGSLGGFVDALVMRLVDVFLAVPYIVLAVAVAAVLGRTEQSLILVLGLTGWLTVTRLVRASFLQLREREFVEAARALGFSRWRVATRHVLPNALQPVIVYATTSIGGFILAEAALSFLGVGPQDPTPAWGLMVSQAQGSLTTASHLVLIPGAAIFLTVLAFVVLGDGLRDAFDPTLD